MISTSRRARVLGALAAFAVAAAMAVTAAPAFAASCPRPWIR